MTELLTLNAIRAHGPCEDGWRKLLAYLGKTGGDDEKLSMLTVLESNGVDDPLWCLRCIKGRDSAIRLLACDFAQAVAHFNADPRVQAAIDVARRYANGDATDAEMDAARDAAWDARAAAEAAARDAAYVAEAAARAAAYAAEAAARAAAYAAARAAAYAAARDAAYAAEAAARAAAYAAARAAAYAAAYVASEAAADAAWAAADAAARAAESGKALGMADDAITTILRRWIIEQEAA